MPKPICTYQLPYGLRYVPCPSCPSHFWFPLSSTYIFMYTVFVWIITQHSYAWRVYSLQWRHNDRNGVSNHWRLDCLPNRMSRRRSKKTSKLRGTGLCEGNSPVTGELSTQTAITAEMFPFDDAIILPDARIGDAFTSEASKCPTLLGDS